MSEHNNTISSEDRIDIKKKAILEQLKIIVDEKNRNKKLMIRYRKRNNFFKTSTHFSNAVSISSLFTSMATLNPFTLILGSVFASCSTIGSAINDSMNNETKYQTTRTTYLQLSNLERDTRGILLRNHLTSDQLDELLSDLNHRIGLIADSSLF